MTLIVALFFFGGVQLFFMGLIGEYVLAIHGQVREKPVVFERERINFESTLRAGAQGGNASALANRPVGNGSPGEGDADGRSAGT